MTALQLSTFPPRPAQAACQNTHTHLDDAPKPVAICLNLTRTRRQLSHLLQKRKHQVGDRVTIQPLDRFDLVAAILIF